MNYTVGYTYEADVFCVDCTKEDGMLADGATDFEGNEAYRVSSFSEWDGQPHCGNGKECVNATTEHAYSHDLPVGQPIDVTALMYAEDIRNVTGEFTDSPELFEVFTGSFKFTYEIERIDGQLEATFTDGINRGTLAKAYEAPDIADEAAAEYVREYTDEINEELN